MVLLRNNTLGRGVSGVRGGISKILREEVSGRKENERMLKGYELVKSSPF